MRARHLFPLFCLLLAAFIWGCKGAGTKEKVRVDRFDRVLDEYVSLGSYTSLQKMNTQYPQQTKLLIEDVLDIGSVEEPDVEQRLRYFYLDSTVQLLLEEVHRQYADMSDIEEGLTLAFDRMKKEDPDFPIPHVYTQISCLRQSIVVYDTLIGISLDKYLGEDYPPYRRYFHANQLKSMTRDNIVADALTFYLLYSYVSPETPKMDSKLPRSIARVHWVVAHILGIPPRNSIPSNRDTKKDIDISPWLVKVDAYMKENPQTTVLQLLQMKD
ncbi:MAG: gliding motility protein GldB [Bacteroidaceae bacterium]|nr:gliding motility protein GldB [Bacteroidaceae bacterium]